MAGNKKNYLWINKFLIFIFAFIFHGLSFAAGNSSANINVTANVVSYCNISTSTATLTFPEYMPTSGNNSDASTSLTVTCTMNNGYMVGLSAGNGPNAAYNTSRSMKNGTNLPLNYNLYKDNTYQASAYWGDTTGSMVTGTLTNATSVVLPVYGRIPSGQTGVIVGTYTDTVVATVYY